MLSIIVPVYNCEQYLSQCLDSILDQPCRSLELILVNDGSTDSSPEICRSYAAKDPRIVLINKSNSGVSDARNTGLDRAQGDYILFVDSDDLLLPGALTEIGQALDRFDSPELLVWGFQVFGNNVMANDTDMLTCCAGPAEPEELLRHLVSTDHKMRLKGYIWRCAYKRELLERSGIRFLSHLCISEDFKFLLDTILAVKTAAILDKELYAYRLNDASVTSHYRADMHQNMSWVNQWIEENVCPDHPELELGFHCCCAETYVAALQNLCNYGSRFGLWGRILAARRLRAEYGYTRRIRVAVRQTDLLSPRRLLVYRMLRLHLEPVYLLLYSLKKKTLFRYGRE